MARQQSGRMRAGRTDRRRRATAGSRGFFRVARIRQLGQAFPMGTSGVRGISVIILVGLSACSTTATDSSRGALEAGLGGTGGRAGAGGNGGGGTEAGGQAGLAVGGAGGQAPHLDAATDAPPSFCEWLARGATFATAELLWCVTPWGGDGGPPSPSQAPDYYCHYALDFHGSKVMWTQTDNVASGQFTCSGASIVAFGENGTWDADHRQITFSGLVYHAVKADGGL